MTSILIVDDDVVITTELEELLTSMNYEVVFPETFIFYSNRR